MRIREFGNAKRLPLAPADSKKAPIDAGQMIEGQHAGDRHDRDDDEDPATWT